MLVEAGRVLEDNFNSERISQGERFSELREAGLEQLGQVRIAVLEL